MTRRRKKSRPELLGFHGLVIGSNDPDTLARRWMEATGLDLLARSRREVVLGGPELFVIVRKRRGASAGSLEEVHLAVDDVSSTRRRASPDALGGDSWKEPLGGFTLVVRQFQRPPAPRWRRRRRG